MEFLNQFLLIGLPYTVLVTFLVGTIYRYKATKFSYSSLSSQFLESRKLFWGVLPFHWGLVFLFFGHLTAFLIPREVLAFNSQPVRLLILEGSALIFGLLVLFGLVALIVRRMSDPRLKLVTTGMDYTILGLLLLQTIFGVVMALTYRWGSSWFAAVITPYLRSIFIFRPEINAVSALPWLIKLHIVLAYLIFAMVPFSRLVHLLVFPIHYIWRPYQRVIWNWPRRSVRNPKTEWNVTKPQNN